MRQPKAEERGKGKSLFDKKFTDVNKLSYSIKNYRIYFE
jgi:hypothetical protein